MLGNGNHTAPGATGPIRSGTKHTDLSPERILCSSDLKPNSDPLSSFSALPSQRGSVQRSQQTSWLSDIETCEEWVSRDSNHCRDKHEDTDSVP